MTENKIKRPRQELVGHVVGDKMKKTIKVLIYRQIRQKKYGKYLRKKVIFKAHDEKNQARLGDKVCIFETRPQSKTKRWRLKEVISKQETV